MLVLIAGGGIGGLAAAAALTSRGIDVRVYEQADRICEVGAGVSLAPNGLRLLGRLGFGDSIARYGAAMTDNQVCLADGRPAPVPDRLAKAGENVGMHRADLVATLASRLPPGTVRTGHRCTGFGQDDSGTVLMFADGSSAAGDVVIGADGIHSALRPFVSGAAGAPAYSGVVAFRGLVRPGDWPAGRMRMWMGSGQHFLVYPVRGNKLLNYVAFVGSAEPAAESWSAAGDHAALAAAFAPSGGWDPAIGAVIASIEGNGFCSGLYDRAPSRHWVNGRLALLGDAAHPMLPHLGQGANQAIEDACVLALLLASADGDVPAALAAYQDLRTDRVARIQRGSRINGTAYDSSGSGALDLGWIHDYDAEAACSLR